LTHNLRINVVNSSDAELLSAVT